MMTFSIAPSWFHIAAGVCAIALGIAYMARSGATARQFKLVLSDHRRVLVMALVNQGLALCFAGAILVMLSATGSVHGIGLTISYVCAAALFVFGGVTAATGGRGEFVLFRLGQIALVAMSMLVLVGNAKR